MILGAFYSELILAVELGAKCQRLILLAREESSRATLIPNYPLPKLLPGAEARALAVVEFGFPTEPRLGHAGLFFLAEC